MTALYTQGANLLGVSVVRSRYGSGYKTSISGYGTAILRFAYWKYQMNPNTKYSPAAIAIHWLAALMILCAIALGVYMTGLQMSPARLQLYNWHKLLGNSILVLSVLRLSWRLTHSPPADLPMATGQRRAADATPWAMYPLFFAVPLAGWAYSSATRFPGGGFGVVAPPPPVGPGK